MEMRDYEMGKVPFFVEFKSGE